ncbi:hypothetical protein [Arthrobacter sp. OY3WO11]|uniref:hypothetical protein n=1 Tax=Arthrobacter sp. OY3WO11 TaxID=1835723 RepID=UPI0007D018DB|nr:hypothetical protein [Arthrobacter sp. OY3WO11]OAE02023.1 hypothetical protein A6A22_11735 [Arthrobacter sp. OY3WO11]
MRILVAYATRHGATAGIAERMIRLAPASKEALPPGDFRDWDAIDTGANEIAAELKSGGEPVPDAGQAA